MEMKAVLDTIHGDDVIMMFFTSKLSRMLLFIFVVCERKNRKILIFRKKVPVGCDPKAYINIHILREKIHIKP